jgi:glutathione S-transferase
MSERARLITIAPSHYCEKARWGLDHFGVDYVEEPHPPILHWLWSLPSGGGRTVPILRVGRHVIGDSTAILRYLDAEHGGGRGLYPTDADLAAEVERLEESFDVSLGPHTRRLVYFHLLSDRSLALETLGCGVASGQRFVFTAGFPLFRSLMRRGMKISAASAERSAARSRKVFAEVGERLEEGRRFLVGAEFTAADLTFAALAAPVLLPPGYGAPLPSPDRLDDTLRALVEGFRSTPAGAFALRLYDEWR